MRTLLKSILIGSALILAAPAALAEKPAVYTGAFSDIAVGGYDAVAYFKEGTAVKGEKEFSTMRDGFEYRFASQENLDAFQADPQAYLPQFGGYCAWAVSEGKLAKGDPNFWSIVDGKLYLNYNKSIKSKWESKRDYHIENANKNWPTILED